MSDIIDSTPAIKLPRQISAPWVAFIAGCYLLISKGCDGVIAWADTRAATQERSRRVDELYALVNGRGTGLVDKFTLLDKTQAEFRRDLNAEFSARTDADGKHDRAITELSKNAK